MSDLRLYILGLFLLFVLPATAQGPDRLPPPSLPEEVKEGTAAYAQFEVPDSLLETNVLLFCGEKLNLDPMNRQRKLRRELSSLRRTAEVMIERAGFFFPIVEPILETHGIPSDFKYLMVIESGMNPEARSPAGALGLWQFMPATAVEYGLQVDRKRDERLDIEKSTHAACRYIKAAYAKFNDWVAAAQSYNIGQNRIGKELRRQNVESIDLQLVEETNRYIYRILAMKILFTHPGNFGLKTDGIRYPKLRRR